MSFPTIQSSDASFHLQANQPFSQRQTPVWVFVCFCVLLITGMSGAGHAVASTQSQIRAAGCSEMLINGGFEVKDLGWQSFGAESPPAYTTSPIFSGEQAMRLGIVEGANLAIINGVRQTVFLPNSAASLVLGFHYRPIHESLPGDDLQYLELYDANSGVRLFQLHAALNTSTSWIFLQYDLTPLKGRTIRIDVGVRNDGGGGRTAMIIDDLSLLSCDSGSAPTVTPTGLSMLATPTPTPTNPLTTVTATVSPSVSPTPSVSTTATGTAIFVTPSTATPIPTGCVDMIQNGSFEQPLGSSTGWLPGDIDPIGPVLSSEQADGLRSMQLGNPPGVGTQDVVTYSSIRQLVHLPPTASTAKLTWKHQSRSQEVPSDGPVPAQDRQELILLHPNLDTKAVRQRWRENVPSWQSKEDDLTQFIGDTFYIYFNVFNDANSTRTWMFLDEVRLILCFSTAVATYTSTPLPSGDTATPTPSAVGTALGIATTPMPGSTIIASGLPTPESSVMLSTQSELEPLVTNPAPSWRAQIERFRPVAVVLFVIAFLIVLYFIARAVYRGSRRAP